LIAYTPEGSNIKLKMLCASSRSTLRRCFGQFEFNELQVTSKTDINEGHYIENTRELTAEERRAAMTSQEQDLEDAKEASACVQASAPMKLAGLATVRIHVLPDFDDAMKVVMESENKACLGVLSGPKHEELSGKVLDDIEDATCLKGKLPEEEACYVVIKGKGEAEGQYMVIAWQPDSLPAKQKMKSSTFKASVVENVKAITLAETVTSGSITCEDDLHAQLGQTRASVVVASEEPEEEVHTRPKGGPPAGAVRMPGMGAPMAGGFKLPGMGR